MSQPRSRSVATMDEAEESVSASLMQKAIRTWELSFLTPKLRFIKTQYGQRFIVNFGGFAVTMLCIAAFIYFFFAAYTASATTKYLANDGKDVDNGRILQTTCNEVAKIISNDYSLGRAGIWSTDPEFYTQQTVFSFNAAEMEVDNAQFESYMTDFQTEFTKFRTNYLSKRPWSENLKRMLGYRFETELGDFRGQYQIDFDSILSPSRYGMYINTPCGKDFSDADENTYVNLDTGVYSYDRRVYADSAIDSEVDDDLIRFQWNFEVQSDPHASKTAFDGQYFIDKDPYLPWYGTNDTSTWSLYEGSIADVSLDGADAAAFRLTSSACPAGFTGKYSGGILTCKFQVNKNLAVLAAALNEQAGITDSGDDAEADRGDDAAVEPYMDEKVELINVTEYRFISRKYVSGDYIVKVKGMYTIAANGYLFLPTFDHWTDGCDKYTQVDGERYCKSSRASCYTNNFELDFIPLNVVYDAAADNGTFDPFTTPNVTIDCKLFAPFYAGPQSDSSVSSCTYDDSIGCYLDYVGDGWCDALNNNACCGWDGGDCCESSCSVSEYPCGSNGYACCSTDSDCESSCPFVSGAAGCPADIKFDDDNYVVYDDAYYMDDYYNRTRRRNLKAAAEVKISPQKDKTNNNKLDVRGLGQMVRKNMHSIAAVKTIESYNSLFPAFRVDVSRAANKHRNAGLYDVNHKPAHNMAPGLHEEPRVKGILKDYNSGIRPSANVEGRRLATIPWTYDLVDIPYPPVAAFEYLALGQPVTDTDHKYGYIEAYSDGEDDFPNSYLCYSKALISQGGLCQSLCNAEYSDDYSLIDEEEALYGGFMVSALTFSKDEDLGQMMLNAATGSMSFIMASAIHFVDDFENGMVQIAGQYSELSGTQTVTETTPGDIGKEYGTFPETQVDAETTSEVAFLPCEPAACYCYKRYRPMESVFVLNVENERDFINGEFFEIGGNKGHCNDPFEGMVIPKTAPEPLVEKFYECKSVTQLDVGTVFGSTLANVTTIQEALMVLLIMFLTQIWFKACMGKEMESITEDDDDFEMETRRLVTEAARARKLCGGNIGEALIEVLQRKNEEAIGQAAETGSAKSVEMSIRGNALI